MSVYLPAAQSPAAGRAVRTDASSTGRSPAADRISLLILCAVWLVSCLYVWHLLDHNWIPHDDGVLAQSAERVLQGEMPHRDFAAIYSGGLSYLNAAGFRLFGIRLMALRDVLYLFLVVWVPVVYYCASRFVSAPGAGAATMLAVVWTVPNYPAAMPSWYNLFFATFGAAALLRYAERRGRGWLVVAGAMGGCSIVVKVTGCYYVAAGLLYLVVHEVGRGLDHRRRGPSGYAWLVGIALVVPVFGLLLLLRGHLTPEHTYHFLLPPASLLLLTGYAAAGGSGRATAQRAGRLWELLWPFLLGLAIPCAVFLAPYVASGAVRPLLHGVFVSPMTRLTAAAMAPPGLLSAVPAVLLAGVLVYARRVGAGIRGWVVAGLWLTVLLTAQGVGGAEYLYLISWASVAEASPLVVAAGVAVLLLRRPTADAVRWEQSFLMLAVAGFTSLIALPFSAPIYFCYSAPLALLALLSTLRLVGGPPRPLAALLAVWYTGFAVFMLNTQSINELGYTAKPAEPLALLDLPRGGVLVGRSDAIQYEELAAALRSHARGGYTFVGPDAPEVYFLAGLRNPTRLLFDFVEPSAIRADRVLAEIDHRKVTAVATARPNGRSFSGPLSPDLETGLEARFPASTTIGRFTVRWRP